MRPLLAASAAWLAMSVPAQQRDFDALDAQITDATLRAPLRLLSTDLFEGRGVGSRGDELTRRYLASQLELFGLQPGGPDGSWEQPVPILGITATVAKPMTVHGGDGRTLTFAAPNDYVAFAARPDPTTSWQDVPVVFVGYGIDAPEQEWDDYGEFDVRGKVVLVMNNDPESQPDLFAGKRRLYYGRWTYKYEEAARRGAVGAIVIHTTPSAGYPFQVIQAGHGQEAFWLPFEPGTPTLHLRSWCSEDAARQIAGLGGHDLDALRATAETREFAPVDLGVRIDLATDNVVREISSANVLGILPGGDPELRDEVVVVTAHFDHLGIGPEKNGDPIYNGALDNASGCSAALNLARVCGSLAVRPRRTLLFAFVTAEESGLLGSLYYSLHPTVPQQRLIADFNIDGINIWGAANDIELVGHGKNTLTALAEMVATRRQRRVEPDTQVDLGLFYRSDNFSFARIGVPSAYFKAGNDFLERKSPRQRLKASYTTVHYHQPSDEFDDRWVLDGGVADTRLILECLLHTADADDAPRWTPGDEFERLR